MPQLATGHVKWLQSPRAYWKEIQMAKAAIRMTCDDIVIFGEPQEEHHCMLMEFIKVAQKEGPPVLTLEHASSKQTG